MSSEIASKEKVPLSPYGGLKPLEKKKPLPPTFQQKKVILLAGPTACGKTTLSLMLAEKLLGEIVSADSCQVYRGMDIGTAKVSQEDRDRIPHHLIDIRHIQEPFNVVDFYYEATQVIESILARGRVPIVVGGSGFYFRSLTLGPPQGPPSLPNVRCSLEKELETSGPEAMYQKLKEFDPTYAATITPKDKQKIVRGLEIVTITGEKVSKFDRKKGDVKTDFAFHAWFLYRPKEALYPRINERCDQMLDAGLIDEVKELLDQGLLTNTSAAQAIGYRQVIDFLKTSQTEEDYEKFKRQFKMASRHYAKRQFTWFRKEPLFRWLNIEVHDFEIAADMIMRDYYGHVS